MKARSNIINIHDLLPHLKPMLMVDVISHICVENVVTFFTVVSDCIFIEDNCLTEAGLIENAAQTCSSISGQYYFDSTPPNQDQNNPNVLGFISSIKKIKLHRLPTVGTQIKTEAFLISQVQMPDYSICTLKVITYHLDTLFLEGEMNLFLQKK